MLGHTYAPLHPSGRLWFERQFFTGRRDGLRLGAERGSVYVAGAPYFIDAGLWLDPDVLLAAGRGICITADAACIDLVVRDQTFADPHALWTTLAGCCRRGETDPSVRCVSTWPPPEVKFWSRLISRTSPCPRGFPTRSGRPQSCFTESMQSSATVREEYEGRPEWSFHRKAATPRHSVVRLASRRRRLRSPATPCSRWGFEHHDWYNGSNTTPRRRPRVRSVFLRELAGDRRAAGGYSLRFPSSSCGVDANAFRLGAGLLGSDCLCVCAATRRARSVSLPLAPQAGVVTDLQLHRSVFDRAPHRSAARSHATI